jgi:hypothetical protein
MKPHHLLAVVCLILAMVLIAIDQGWIDAEQVIPDPKPETVWAFVIEESKDRGDYPKEYPAMVMSPEVRELFPKFRLIDKDDQLPTTEEIIKQKGLEHGLPALVLASPDGQIHYTGDVPLSVEDWRVLKNEVTR